jgi:2-methylisocitrate lyase-like PEP mutase family enzyme
MTATQAEKAKAFRDLHREGCFILPNAWDAGSAKLLAASGFAAVGTTSLGLAFSLGKNDGAGEVGLDDALANIRAIAAAPVPVSADFENGYAHPPEAAAANVRRAIEAGAVGCTFEDWSCEPDGKIYDIELAVDRVRAAVEAAEASGIAFTLTARAEGKLRGRPDPLKEAITRLNRFAEAGAHCLYAPGFTDRGELKTLIAEVNGPVNVLVGIAGMNTTLEEMRELGARRLSVGGTLMRYALSAAADAAEAMKDGRFAFANETRPNTFFAKMFG